MTQIKQVAYGAYFVPAYSVQTVIMFQPGITTQAVISEEETDVLWLFDEFDDQTILDDPKELDNKKP